MPQTVTADDRTLLALCEASAVEEDTPLLVRTDAMDYAVFRQADAVYVIADLCTHGPGSLSEGYVEGCEVECPFHQGKFDFRTGQPTAPPCDTALRIWTPILIDGQVCIDPDEHRDDKHRDDEHRGV